MELRPWDSVPHSAIFFKKFSGFGVKPQGLSPINLYLNIKKSVQNNLNGFLLNLVLIILLHQNHAEGLR